MSAMPLKGALRTRLRSPSTPFALPSHTPPYTPGRCEARPRCEGTGSGSTGKLSWGLGNTRLLYRRPGRLSQYCLAASAEFPNFLLSLMQSE